MAKEGIRFEQFYVNSPICSPSRVAISTGQYPQRWKISSYLGHRAQNVKRGMAQWLDPKAPMLARFLQNSGYATGHFGKWHMGGQRDVNDAPAISDYGFDQSLSNFEGMGPKLLPLTLKPGQDKAKPGRIWQHAERLGKGFKWMQRSEITGQFVDSALPFIDQAKKAGKPFYLNLWPDDVHSPFWPPVDKWGDGSKKQLYLSVLEEMDRQLGRLFQHIQADPELAENTIILTCSDNGPDPGLGSPGPFRGYKTQLFEGGIRSSLIAWAPKLMKKDALGTINQESIFSAIDLVPTLLSICKVPYPQRIAFDGESLPDVLLGQSKKSKRKKLFFRRPPDRNSFYGVKDLPDLAVRNGRWKLLCEYDGSAPLLYDLLTDLEETKNLAKQKPSIVAELTQSVVAWHKSMPADNGPALESKSN
ncbi:MAG: sulfatase-like hydrolase/transferase [Opitutales bacterium]|nr:sulfatase-like hydrolase/transferase [Opitutales bacterium]